ncbi:MAG: putative restriction endonuclease, partial [Planktomarina sp.]
MYDALFDKYLISFDDEGKIIISGSIKPKNLEKLGL